MHLKIGYGRTSTLEQQAGLDAQHRDLTAAGCAKIFSEQVSAVGKRPQLEAALDFIRERVQDDTILACCRRGGACGFRGLTGNEPSSGSSACANCYP